jgi:hypothetical protein
MSDNQTALTEAVKVAVAADKHDPTEIVSMAQAFFAFLSNPGGATAAAAAQVVAQPAAEALGAAPLENGVPADAPAPVDASGNVVGTPGAPAPEPAPEPPVDPGSTAPETVVAPPSDNVPQGPATVTPPDMTPEAAPA